MRKLILGTAGHIDHGKTELVRALTGVDTDRLREEKERGITIDLGFAELATDELGLGVVDVPGHEGFIRNMLAGATGMDIVLLVIAADEGVMPQTREHLAIVELLGVERLVVTLSKADLVEPEWLELVRDEVAEVLAPTTFAGSPIVVTSARTGEGLERLVETLGASAVDVARDEGSDLARLPVDRVFTVRGTGTVVTGTLWSGTLRVGDRVRVLPGEVGGRIRGLEVHGRATEAAGAGERVAVALAGSDVDRGTIVRGRVLVSDEAWRETHMLTARVRVLRDSAWVLEHGQRVRVHVGTAEVMARVVLFGAAALPAGGEGWAQLRLEAPVVARARERFVLRSYSPVTTFAGGVIAEPDPPKRKRLTADTRELLGLVLGGTRESVAARARLAGWSGEAVGVLPVTTGLGRDRVLEFTAALPRVDADVEAGRPCVLGDLLLDSELVCDARRRLLGEVAAFHAEEPLRPGIPVDRLRAALPVDAPPELADALLAGLVGDGRLVVSGAVYREAEFEPTLTAGQQRALSSLESTYRESGLAPPTVEELRARSPRPDDVWPLVRLLEARGTLTRLEDGLYVDSDALRGVVVAVRERLGGCSGLGPADFREVVPVTRKHLIPILGYFDETGVTARTGNTRDVPAV